MSLTNRKITSFTKKVADLPDRPSPAYTPSQIKSQFDSSPEELRVAHNGLIDDLSSVTPGSSGAEQVGSAPITGVTGTTVYGQLSDIKTQIETNANNFGKVTVAGQSDVVADAKADTLTLAGGTGITVTTNAATDTVTITATGNATPGAHASSHITGGTDIIPNAVSGGNAGLLSGADKASYDAHLTDNVKHVPYAVATGTANVYAATLSPAPGAYVEGVAVAVKVNVANTGATTININGLGAKSILKANGNALSSGNLKVNSIYTLRYNGTSFILQGEGGEYGTAGAAQVLAPYTIGTESGLVAGTLVPTNITSKQDGFVTWTEAATTTKDIPISTVDTTKSIILIKYVTSQNANVGAIAPTLLNATTVRLTKNTAGAFSAGMNIYWEVIEFDNVKSKQTGTIAGAGSEIEAVVPVSAVNGSKCILLTYNTNTTATVSTVYYMSSSRVINSTSIGITANQNGTVYWQLIEFN